MGIGPGVVFSLYGTLPKEPETHKAEADMAEVKEAYSTKEMAEMLGFTVRSTPRRAQRENWQSRPRSGRGGGKEWLLSSMPPATRLAVASALVRRMAEEARRPTPAPALCPPPASRNIAGEPDRQERILPGRAWQSLGASRQDRAASRSVLVQMAQKFAAAQQPLPLTSAYELFAMRYNGGDISAPDWVRGQVARLCRGSLLNWQRALAAAGPEALGGRHGRHRIGTGAMDQPYIYAFILGHIYKYPQAGATHIYKGLAARLALQARPERLPSLRRLQAWYKAWLEQHAELFTYLSNPDLWRSRCRVAFGDAAALVDRLNQEWEMDSTPADLILADGKRHTIVGCIDLYSRRLTFHVSRVSSSHAVATCLRKAMGAWGVPEMVRTDNGQDYVSRHITRVLLDLDVYQDVCAPFSPEQKPFIERAFKSLLHDTLELLQGYVGHNVSERKALEARKSFAQRMMTPEARVELNLSAEELQKICDHWAKDTYMHRKHSRLGCTPYEQALAYDGPIRRVESPEALRMLCLPLADGDGTRVVHKDGIHLYGDQYVAAELALHVGSTVQAREDDEDRRLIHVYSLDGEDFICTARGRRQDSVTRDELRAMAVAARRRQKEHLAGEMKGLREAARAAQVQEIGYERMKADELRAREIEKTQPLRAELMDIHCTPGLLAAEQAARRPDYRPAPMTEEERAGQEKSRKAMARALAEGLSTATADLPEERYLRALNILEFLEEPPLKDRTGIALSLPPEEYHWLKRYMETPEYRTQKRLHEMYGEERLGQIRAMSARAGTRG
jgi:hypothetical protein